MLRRPYTLITAAACAVTLGAAGCGATHNTATNHRAKRMVLAEASLGFGAFHRFIWLPARAGMFSDPASPAVTHGAAAADFASAELRVAAHSVRGNKRLQILFAPLELTADKIGALGTALSQHPSLAEIEAINAILNRIATTAKDNGARIADASSSEIAAAGGPDA